MQTTDIRNRLVLASYFTRLVQIGLLFVLLFLGWQWHATRLPEPTQHVAQAPVMDRDVYALITLFPRAQRRELVRNALETYGLAPATQTIAIYRSGSLTAVPQEMRSQFIANQTRPRAWFLPSTLGVVSMQTPTGAATLPIRTSRNGLIIPFATEGFEPIRHLLPNEVSAGSHISCKDGTCTIPTQLSNLVPLSQFHNSDVFLGQNNEITVAFSGDVSLEQALDFARNSQARREPSIQTKFLPDGTATRELVVNAQIPIVTSTTLGVPTYLIGSTFDAWRVTQTTQGTIATTSRIVLEGHLSTLSLTNEVCGRRVSFFMQLNSSQSLAKNQIFLAKARRNILLCSNAI